MLKAVIFDLDGTLLDRDASLRMFVDDQYNRFSNSLHHVSKTKYVTRFIELDNRGYTWKDKVYQELIKEFSMDAHSWEEMLQDYLDNFSKFAIATPNALEILIWLRERKLKIGLISNGFTTFQIGNFQSLGLEHYFDEVLISESEGVRKPDKEIFIRALDRLNVRASEAIYVGDHPINDVEASMSAGLKGIWKKDSYFKDNVAADGVIEDLIELQKIIDEMML